MIAGMIKPTKPATAEPDSQMAKRCDEHPPPAEQLERLRIADGSIMARVIVGNMMAPCAIIGVRAAEILHARHVH
jgi:hypothetical protein